jgi:hypothetical protein
VPATFDQNIARVQKIVDMARYFRKTSSPFISQDTFRRFVDFNHEDKTEFSMDQIASARVIFCNSGSVETFLDLYGKKIQAKVLIFGNNDVDFESFPYKLPGSVRRVYLQNSSISDRFFHTLPIGLENLAHYRNGLPRLFTVELSAKKKNGKALVGPFGDTHENRKSLFAFSNNLPRNIDFLTERINPTQYAHISSNYSYIFCPRGNGLDTHRFWETLYRGSLPVVLKSRWSDSIKDLGIPLLAVENWLEAIDFLNSKPVSLQGLNPKSVPALWEKYWLDEIRSCL